MPLMPKRTKHRKVQKGSRSGSAKAGTTVDFGEYGLKSMSRGWLKATQIEACRVAINRRMKRKGKLWIRVFPDKPVTEKPIEVRMGKGKGNPEYWAAVVRPGRVLFEIAGVPEDVAVAALRLADAKLGLRTRLVRRGEN
jgi:large subunit ribosomal protein L16